MAAPSALVRPDVIHASRSPIQTIAFSHDCRLMAVGDTQRNAKVYFDGVAIHEINLASRQDKIRPTERIRGLAFSPNGENLYAACGDLVRAFSMTTGEQKWQYRPARSFGFLIVSQITLAVSSTGDIAVATDAGRLSLWTPDGALRAHWWDNDSPRQLAFLDDETAVGTDSFSMCTWKMGMSRKLSRKRLHDRIYGFAAAPNAQRVCIRSIHGIEVWDLSADVMVAKHDVPFGPPLVAMSADGNKVFFGGTDELIALDVTQGSSNSFEIQEASIRSLALRPDGTAVVAGCSDGTVQTFRLQ